MRRLSVCSSQTGIADRSSEEGKAQHGFSDGELLRRAALGPSTRQSFGKVGKDEHAGPLVGVAPAFQNALQRKGERQRFQRGERAAGP